MYAKICDLEMLSSYISDMIVGDVLVVQAQVTNPLDWHHFYEKISTIKKGDRTDFTVVTKEGEKLVGSGGVKDLEKWNNDGKFGFKIKIDIKKQKSLSDRRLKLQRTPFQNSGDRTSLAPLPFNRNGQQ
jgi:hypothetical protein